MADVANTVGLIMKADTGPARREIKKLSGEQKKLAKEVLDVQEKQNASLEDSIAKWGKVTLAIGAAVTAFKALASAAKEYGEIARLEATTTGTNIEAIQNAAGGLITKYEALKFAAAALNTDFRLSQKEMEEVAKFMVVLRNEGNDLADVQDRVTKALVEGNAEGLKEFGIVIRGESGTLEAHQQIMEAIAESNEAAGDSIFRAGDEAAIAATQWSDAMMEIKEAAGELAVVLGPVVRALAFIVRGSVGGIKAVQDAVEGIVVPDDSTIARYRMLQNAIGSIERQMKSPSAGEALGDLLEQKKAELAKLEEFALFNPRFAMQIQGFDPEALNANLPLGPAEPTARQQRAMALAEAKRARKRRAKPRKGGAAIGVDLFAEAETVDAQRQRSKSIEEVAASIRGRLPEKEGSLFRETDIFEVPDESFDKIVEGSEVAQEAFLTLENVGARAFQALVTGSESASSAIRKALGSALLGESVNLAGQAIKHGFYALASLAFEDYRGAAQHGRAAASAAAGAVALGGMARALGAGGSGGSGGSMPGAAAESGAGGGQFRGPTNVTVITGSDLDDNPRQATQRVLKQMRRAKRMLGQEEESTVFA